MQYMNYRPTSKRCLLVRAITILLHFVVNIIFIVVVLVLLEMAVIPNKGSSVGSIAQDGVPVGAFHPQ